jgi:hypothetical protein
MNDMLRFGSDSAAHSSLNTTDLGGIIAMLTRMFKHAVLSACLLGAAGTLWQVAAAAGI